jgi:S-adenosylmethionine decarboxylase
MTKLSLHGFNNLTKSLSFSLYKLHYVAKSQQSNYASYINTQYSAKNLSTLLGDICQAIGGNVLNIAMQDYEPQGASVTLMISEESSDVATESIVAHLDKSHLCIHTYPEETLQDNIAIFRADIELSTCGIISPLKVLEYVINAFNADIIDIDYRVRGMTRNINGKKIYNLDNVEKLSDYLSKGTLNKFIFEEHNHQNINLFHSRFKRIDISLSNYLFEEKEYQLMATDRMLYKEKIEQELHDLFTNTE